MKKYHLLLFLCSLLSFFGCKSDTKETVPTKESLKKVEADLGGLYVYYHANPQNLEQREENQIIEYLADNNIDATRTRSGIFIAQKVVGEGDTIRWGDPITVDYRGYFLDGEEFDSSYKRGKPISFRVGSMVAGWNEALPFLTKGSKATFYIPSHMGYGKKGFPGFVGPDKILLFDIEVYSDEKE